MFATPTSYCVTPGARTPFARLPSRASTLLRDVKRRSLRSYRGASSTEHTEKRLSGISIISHTYFLLWWRLGAVTAVSCVSVLRRVFAGTFHQLKEAGCAGCRDTGKLSSGHLPLPAPLQREDKENLMPEVSAPPTSPLHTPPITRTQSLRRRCSNYFTPKSKRVNRDRTAMVRTPSTRRPSVTRRPSLSATPAKESPKAVVSGAGRLIPVKQGYMYKRSGSSRLYRRKYVTLCGDSVLTYWPSFQAYIDNVEGKEIQLGHVTVKVPGRPPAGIRMAEEEEDRSADVSLEELEEGPQEGVELVLVSLDSTTWHFQVCSPREVRQWEAAIQAEILASLTRREARPDLDRVRGLPGNAECADCGSKNPDWASLNLGILVCIECSGIHRNLGSHISKVRSLALDCWPQANLAALEVSGGNTAVNSVWEGRLIRRPGGDATRAEKEEFIRAKYILRAFCSPASISSHGVLI